MILNEGNLLGSSKEETPSLAQYTADYTHDIFGTHDGSLRFVY